MADGDLAAYAGGTPAYTGGVLIDFPVDGESRLVFDEHAEDRTGQSLRGYDVAFRGTRAVTATGYVNVAGASLVELRHYECR